MEKTQYVFGVQESNQTYRKFVEILECNFIVREKLRNVL